MQKFLSIILLACVALAQTQNQIDFGAEDREEQDRLQACLFYQCFRLNPNQGGLFGQSIRWGGTKVAHFSLLF